LLGQQYLEHPKFQPYLTSHFVLFRADRTQKQGEEIFNKFSIRATPTIMILDPDGSEVDWHVGYGPPAEKFNDQIDKSYQGIETFKYYSGMYAKNPKDVAAVFGLAKKYDRRYNQEKAVALYKEAIALDPDGKGGMTDYGKIKVPNTQYAEYQIGSLSLFGMKVDPEPTKAFIKKYKSGEMVKSAYQRLAMYYSRSGSGEEVAKFFEDALANVPNDPQIVSSYVRKSVSAKENLDKAAGLAEQLTESMKLNPDPMYVRDLADVYVAKGDTAKADSVYGKEFMEGKASMMAYNLLQYATFWAPKGKNGESALEMAMLAAKMRPGEDYYLRQAASVACQLKQPEKGIEVFGPAYVKENSKDANKLSSYAGFWAGQGYNLEGALAAAKMSVELSPALATVWGNLALTYQKMKKYDEAIKVGEKALELAGENQKSFFKSRLDALKREAAEKK
jgi:tetratricopeptide (TPR) repeat protein